VIVAESQIAIREAVAHVLNLRANLKVFASAATCRESINLAWLHQPNIAFIDADMPSESAFSCVESINSSVPNCRTVVIGHTSSPLHVRRAYESKAWAYVHKNQSFDEIARVLESVHSGTRMIDLKDWQITESPLTGRETEVLQAIAAVGSTSEIAKQMYLSHGTINNYVSSILTKLHATNRVQAIIIAKENGWL
jgi:two-component system response regulator DesR